MNGWFFELAHAPTPTQEDFSLSCSNDGASWTVLSYVPVSYYAAARAGDEIFVDLRNPIFWQWVLGGPMLELTIALGFFALMLCHSRCLGVQDYGKYVFASTWGFLVVSNFPCAVYNSLKDRMEFPAVYTLLNRNKFVHWQVLSFEWTRVLLYLMLSLTSVLFERHIVPVFAANGVGFFLSWVVTQTVVNDMGDMSLVQAEFTGLLMESTLFLLPALYVYVRRFHALGKARSIVRQDQHTYGQLFKATLQGEGLASLQALQQSIASAFPAQSQVRTVRQYNRAGGPTDSALLAAVYDDLSPAAVLIASEALKAAPSQMDRASPVKSLDQIYAQAAGVDGLLQAKVQQWALESRGYFRVGEGHGGSHGYVLWEAAAADPALRAAVSCGELKRPGRAIEKLIRCYRRDVSALVDVCRKSVVFDTVADLAACVRAIAADAEVVVERIKNRLDPAYDARVTAGYRDVAVNLRVASAAARRLGVDTHVCEIQLMLRAFADMKHAEGGHARYILVRNIRCE